ncbi:MAG: thiol reductase thioredoxin [candidate division Zixibacteria bacterium]|nr:thiol reductase thioredoxin [candidate division Zixibacteria bacterium]
MIELNRGNFKEVVDQQAIVVIECWAPGCGGCKLFDPVFAEVAGRYPNHTFARMNVATDEKLGEFFEITHTPCLMVYRDGLLLLKKPGTYTETALNDIIRQTESLDMEVVRADVESSQTHNQTERTNDD